MQRMAMEYLIEHSSRHMTMIFLVSALIHFRENPKGSGSAFSAILDNELYYLSSHDIGRQLSMRFETFPPLFLVISSSRVSSAFTNSASNFEPTCRGVLK